MEEIFRARIDRLTGLLKTMKPEVDSDPTADEEQVWLMLQMYKACFEQFKMLQHLAARTSDDVWLPDRSLSL